jgi:hypothetical protein
MISTDGRRRFVRRHDASMKDSTRLRAAHTEIVPIKMTSALNPRVTRPRCVFNLHQWRKASRPSKAEIEKRQRKMMWATMHAVHTVSIAKARDEKYQTLPDCTCYWA